MKFFYEGCNIEDGSWGKAWSNYTKELKNLECFLPQEFIKELTKEYFHDYTVHSFNIYECKDSSQYDALLELKKNNKICRIIHHNLKVVKINVDFKQRFAKLDYLTGEFSLSEGLLTHEFQMFDEPYNIYIEFEELLYQEEIEDI